MMNYTILTATAIGKVILALALFALVISVTRISATDQNTVAWEYALANAQNADALWDKALKNAQNSSLLWRETLRK